MFIPTIYNIQLNITFKISLLYKQNENYINGKIYPHGCADQVLVNCYRERKKREIQRERRQGEREEHREEDRKEKNGEMEENEIV